MVVVQMVASSAWQMPCSVKIYTEKEAIVK